MARKKRKSPQRRQPKPPGQRFTSRGMSPEEMLRIGAEPLRRRAAERGEADDILIALPAGGVGVSEMLRELVEPLREDDTDFESYDHLLRFGMIAWNASLMSWLPRLVYTRSNFGRVPRQGRRIVKRAFFDLIARKRELFGGCNHWIVDFELSDLGGRWHLTALSEVDDDGSLAVSASAALP